MACFGAGLLAGDTAHLRPWFSGAEVPAKFLGIAGVSDLVDGGKEAGQKWVDDYTGRCYHQACDAWDENWNLAGAAQDIALFYTIGDELARSGKWPGWKSGSEFKALRDQTAATRK